MANLKTIKKIFADVAGTYDLTNRILTVCLDLHWRSRAAAHAARFGGNVWLDVCSGTGDMALELRRKACRDVRIIAADICPSMLYAARKKSKEKNIEFKTADSKNLPFKDNSVDLITISFATRNLNAGRDELAGYFREFFRVLKPGGRFINLETSRPESRLAAFVLFTYARIFIEPVGYLVSGSRTAYRYLSYTIRHFYSAEELAGIMREAGFKKAEYFYLTFGLCAVHSSEK